MSYEVYICKYKDEVVYVGQGKIGRHNHCTSGCSHVYELNKLHFEGETVYVKVTIVSSREKSLEMESNLIKLYKPRYNKIGVNDSRYTKAAIRSQFKNELRKQVEHSDFTDIRKTKLYNAIDEFMHYHTHDMLLNEGLKLRTKGQYYTAGLRTLGSISGYLYYGGYTEKSLPNAFKVILEKIYSLCYNVNGEIYYHD